MSECPDKGCHEKVDAHQKTLYDPVTGIVNCIQKKVSWKVLGGTVLVLFGILTTVVLYAMGGEKKQNEKIAEIPVIQKDIEHIKGNIKTINTAVEDIRKEMRKQINKDDLERLIDAVKKGR